MGNAIDHIHGSARLRRVLGLGLSGAALLGLVYFEGASAQAEDDAEAEERIEAQADADAVDEAPIIVPPAAPVAVAPSGAATTAVGSAVVLAVADTTLADLPVEPAPTLVAVPDLDGLSLFKARKQLKAVGLKLAVRDEYGEKLPREYWSGYRVRSQKLEPGTEVEPGATVRVKARMRQSYSMGY